MSETLTAARLANYRKFVAFIVKTFSAGGNKNPSLVRTKIQELAIELMPEYILYGSKAVHEAHLEWIKLSKTPGGDPMAVLWAMERLLLALRNDLTGQEERFGEGELLKLFINDIDTVTQSPFPAVLNGPSK